MYLYYKICILIAVIFLFIFSCITLFSDDINKEEDSQKSQNIEQIDSKVKGSAVEITDKKLFVSILSDVNLAKNQGDWDKSLEKLHMALALTKKISFSWLEVANKIGEINTKIIHTLIPSQLKVKVEVTAQNLLEKIARNHRTTYQQIMKLNRIEDARRVYEGQQVWVYPGPWKIEVYKSQYKLLLFNRGKLFKVYNIGVGKHNNTPEGKFTILGKITNPIWERIGKKPIPAGDPNNELGSRWMRIVEPTNTYKGFGIHGTIAPNTIGEAVSNGCIRLLNRDVEEIYNFIPEKTQVVIYP